MAAKIGALLAMLLVWGGNPSQACSQDFRIDTRITDERPGASTNGKAKLVCETSTLFHATKVFDYIQGVEQMTIFEPSHKKVTIVSHTRLICTTLTHEQIERMIFQTEKQFAQYINQEIDTSAKGTRDAIRFQLEPKFQETFDLKARTLRLRSPFLTYAVEFAPCDEPKNAEVYTAYADWAARLNYLLNPGTLLPNPRLYLNQTICDKGILPTAVRLDANIGRGRNLKAEHRYHWALGEKDRRQIRHWEELMIKPEMRNIPFEQFQQALIAGRADEKVKR